MKCKMVKENLEQKLEDFLKSMDMYDNSYRGDPDMDYDRIGLYCRWLREIDSNIKELARRLNGKELSYLLDAVEGVSSMEYFVFGTPYGSGYGIRPVLEITRNVLERAEILLTEENRVAYISALGKVYKRTREQADPKYHYNGEEDKKVNGYVNELNQKLDERRNSGVLIVIGEFMRKNFSEDSENE